LAPEELQAVAAEFSVKPRLLSAWRARGLLPRATRFGNDGSRPLWGYPPDTDRRLRAIVRWRRTTRDLETIKVGLWAEGFNVTTEVVRTAILRVVDVYEDSLMHELASFAPPGIEAADLLSGSAALPHAVERFAGETARMRGRSPLPRRVEMQLADRERGMRYGLSLALGLETDPADALQLERILGLSRGRSGTARGVVDWPPSENFRPFSPQSLRSAVETAHEQYFAVVQTMLQTFLQLLRFLFPVLIPADSSVQAFAKDANAIFDEAPGEAIALIAATVLANFVEERPDRETLATQTEYLQVKNMVNELVTDLSDEQKRELARQLRAHRK